MSSVVLGGIAFEAWEVPNKLPFGIKQHHVVHRLMGGQRVVDAMGPDPDPISWTGRLRGPNAMARAMMFRSLAAEGSELELFWNGLAFLVLITDFKPVAEREFEIPYTMTVEVVEDLDAPIGGLISSLDSVIGADLQQAASIVSGIDLATVSDAIGAVSSVVASVGVLQNATAAALAQIETAAIVASDAISMAVGGVESAMVVASPIGVDPGIIADWLTTSTVQAGDLATLSMAGAYVGRIGINIALGVS